MARLLPLEAREIISRTAMALGVPESVLLSPDRGHDLARGRFAIMLMLRDMGWSYPRIAAATQRRDHTTVIHGIRRARQMRCSDPDFIELLEILQASSGSCDFRAGVTDCGPPRAARGGFPYPGHAALIVERAAA